MRLFIIFLLLTTGGETRHFSHHGERQNNFGNLLYNTFCTNVVQDGICPQSQNRGEVTIVDNSRMVFDTITSGAEIIGQVKEILHNITEIEISQEAAERVMTKIVEDVLMEVTRSNIDYFITKYSKKYEESIKHATRVITITVVTTTISTGTFCIGCLCILGRQIFNLNRDKHQQLM